ncbi:MAG TPA: TlpA disulfide reductase family protein [Thermoanaerobaculia bacterium]|nr:TlpA disulfide reductase family protein [Thermoanaerobaculia bacterium]
MSVLEPGARLPRLSLTDESGAPFALPSGEALYAVFKTTCPTCALTWPFLERLRADGGLPIVAVSQDDPPSTRAFAAKLATHLDTAYDAEPWPGSRALGVRTVPTLFRVGRDGAIAETVVGFDRARLEGLARRAAELSRRPPTPLFRPDENVPPIKPG